jgi:hypothetical protein
MLGELPAAHATVQVLPDAIGKVLPVQGVVACMLVTPLKSEAPHVDSVHWKVSKTPSLHLTEVRLAVYPVAQAGVHVYPCAIEVLATLFTLPQRCVAPLSTVIADKAHAEGWQVKVATVPAVHVGVATLGVHPVRQAAVQVCPLVIEVTPVPQRAVAPLVTAGMLATRHGSGLQVNGAMVPSVHAAVVVFCVYPEAQAVVQDCPLAIEVTATPLTLPQSAAAPLATVGMEHGLASQVKVAKVPSVHAAWAALAVYPVAHATVQDCPLAIEVTPVPHTAAAALATVGIAHGSGLQVKAAAAPDVEHVGEATLGVYPVSQAAVQALPYAISDTPLPQCAPVTAKVTPVGTGHAVALQ